MNERNKGFKLVKGNFVLYKYKDSYVFLCIGMDRYNVFILFYDKWNVVCLKSY